MKPRRLPWKWLLLGLIAFLLAGIALLPRKIGSSSQLHDRVTAALSAWTGGEVRLNGPLRVHYFPSVTIKGPFELTDAARLPLVKSIKARDVKITLNLPDLLFGRIRFDMIRLSKADITLKEPAPALKPADHTPQELIANLLAGSPVNVLRFTRRQDPSAGGLRWRDDHQFRCALRCKLGTRHDVELRLARFPQ